MRRRTKLEFGLLAVQTFDASAPQHLTKSSICRDGLVGESGLWSAAEGKWKARAVVAERRHRRHRQAETTVAATARGGRRPSPLAWNSGSPLWGSR